MNQYSLGIALALTSFLPMNASAELVAKFVMPWSVADLERHDGGEGESDNLADETSWLAFVNGHCDKNHSSMESYLTASGTLSCSFNDADVTIDFPGRENLGLSFSNNADITHLNFVSGITKLDLLMLNDSDDNLTDISGLNGLTEITNLVIEAGLGIADLSALDGVTIEGLGAVFINYGAISANNVPEFASGCSFYNSPGAIMLCAGGGIGCYSNGSLTDVSGLANIDPSPLGDRTILLFNKNYAIKAPADSTFCTNWKHGVAAQDYGTDVAKNNVCES